MVHAWLLRLAPPLLVLLLLAGRLCARQPGPGSAAQQAPVEVKA